MLLRQSKIFQNDVKMDYYGTKLATASSDKTVRIFSVECRTGAYHKLAELTGFLAPVNMFYVEFLHAQAFGYSFKEINYH